MGYKQLDFQKRCQIYGFWRAGYNQTEIANEVGVHKSTISRELKRNIVFIRTSLGSWQYKPNYAQTYHEAISKSLNAKFYFAHPYASWERGINENTNGLIRQYLKKGCDFSSIHDRDLLIITNKLNNRPRKSLNYATPDEVFLST